MTLVPQQSPLPLASAVVGQLRSHMDGIGQGFPAYHQLRGNNKVASLRGEECEPPASPAYVLDASEASNKRVRNAKGFQHLPLLDHAVALRARPRAERSSSACVLNRASSSKFRHTKVGPHGFRAVNDLPQHSEMEA